MKSTNHAARSSKFDRIINSVHKYKQSLKGKVKNSKKIKFQIQSNKNIENFRNFKVRKSAQSSYRRYKEESKNDQQQKHKHLPFDKREILTRICKGNFYNFLFNLLFRKDHSAPEKPKHWKKR